MKILYIGAGFVGACSAAVSANSGHDILVFDTNSERVKMLNSGDRDIVEACLFEKGLGDLLVRSKQRIEFTDDYTKVESFLDDCDAVFMCLPTPEIGETGESDLNFYHQAAESLAKSMVSRNKGKQEKYVLVVNKSTVPIDMEERSRQIMDSAGVKEYGIASNPEFLVEGSAVDGAMKPDRVVVGATTDKDFEILRKIYRRFYDSPSVAYIEVNPKEAAAGKLLANFLLFNKLMVCFDVVGRTCETFQDLKFENIRRVLSSDPRIGEWGFYNSLYAGGSCFIKDTRSLAFQLQTAGQGAVYINETYLANKRQLELLFGRAEKEAGVIWRDKIVALLGLSFKRDTNDVRNSPAIIITHFLSEQSAAKINLYDPAAMENFKQMFSETEVVKYFDNERDAIAGADIVIVASDWPQFRGLGDVILASGKTPVILDGRRMLSHQYEELAERGCSVVAVGSPFYKAKK